MPKVSVEKLLCISCTLSIARCSFVLEGSQNLLEAKLFARFFVAELGPEERFTGVLFSLFDYELNYSQWCTKLELERMM
jgi:hypothetical protein